ncbi:hypothetical protein ABTZ58_11445 [Streptomyces sp. NPDC094143]
MLQETSGAVPPSPPRPAHVSAYDTCGGTSAAAPITASVHALAGTPSSG